MINPTIIQSYLGSSWFATRICHTKDLVATSRTKNCHRFGKPNVRVQQVLIANQILAKIMACQIFDLVNFGSEPNQAHNMA